MVTYIIVLTLESTVYTTLTTTWIAPAVTVTVTTTLVEDLYVDCATGTAGEFCTTVSSWSDTTAPPAPTGIASPAQAPYGYRK